MNNNFYKYCPNCGKICKINDVFCNNCGFRFNITASHTRNINRYNPYSNQYFPRTSSSYTTHKQSVIGKIISCLLYGIVILLIMIMIYGLLQ